jgi:aminoglycoside 3'-phosphotransferase-1
VLRGESGATVLRATAANGLVHFLKHGGGAVAKDIVREAARLQWLADRIPCPRVACFHEGQGAAWLLTTAVSGQSGDEWLERDPARLPAIIHGAATVLRRLHAVPAADCPFSAELGDRLDAAYRNLQAGLVDVDDFDDEHAGWTADEVWRKLLQLKVKAGAGVVTHGDFSLGNILFDAAGQVTGLIDLGRLGVADRYQDIAIFWNNLGDFGANAQRQFLESYGVYERDDARLAFYRCLDEFF